MTLWPDAFDRCYNRTEILNVRLYSTESISEENKFQLANYKQY